MIQSKMGPEGGRRQIGSGSKTVFIMRILTFLPPREWVLQIFHHLFSLSSRAQATDSLTADVTAEMTADVTGAQQEN
jgi:hypothetical protein